MPNPYYTYNDTFIPGSRARSGDVDREYLGVEAGFDLLPSDPQALNTGRGAFAGTSAGVGNAYEVSMPTTRVSNTNGDEVIFVADKTNTGAATLNVDSIGAQAIVRADGSALQANDIQIGLTYIVRWDSGNTRYQMVVPTTSYLTDAAASAAAALASETAAGLSEAAAALSETNAGVSETNAAGSATAAEHWAIYPEDSLVPASSGGNEVDEYSAYHWAQKAAGSSGLPIATSGQTLFYNSGWVATSIITVTAGAGTAATFNPTGSQTLYYANTAHMNTDFYGVNISGRQSGTDGGRLTLQGAPTYNTSYFWQSGNNMLAVMGSQTRWLMSGSGGNTFTDSAGTTSWALGSTGLIVNGAVGATDISMAAVGTGTIGWGAHSTNGGFEFRSASGSFEVWERTNVGGLDKQWIDAVDEGGVGLFYGGNRVFTTNAAGAQLRSPVDANPIFELATNGGTRNAYIQAQGTSGLIIENEVHGTPITLQGEDTGGTVRTLAVLDPDDASSLYYAGTARLGTTSTGAIVTGGLLEVDNSAAATAVGVTAWNSEGGLNLTSDGDEIALWHTTSVPAQSELAFKSVSGGAASMYHNNAEKLRTDTNSIQVFSSSSSSATGFGLVSIHGSDESRWAWMGFGAGTGEFRIENEHHGGTLALYAEDTGGTARALFSGDPDGAVDIYDAGTSVARTTTAASGGFEVNNTQTGAGFERVLTESDLTGNILGATKTSTTSRSSTASLALDPDIQISVTPGKWMFEVFAYWSVTTTTTQGIRMAMGYTGGTVSAFRQAAIYRPSSTVPSAANHAEQTNGVAVINFVPTATGNHSSHLFGFIHVTATTTLSLRWAQSVSNANNTSMLAGTSMKMVKVAS